MRYQGSALALPSYLAASARQRSVLALMVVVACLLAGCTAAPPKCAGMVGEPAIAAELYFGRAAVTEAAWREFLATVVTPRFPAGLTQLDGSGQWQPPGSFRIVAEPSTLLRIVSARGPDTVRHLEEVRAAYRTRFAQDSVGLVTTESCASF